MHLLSRRFVKTSIVLICIALLIGIWAATSSTSAQGSVTSTRPDLSVSKTGATWGSYANYLSRELSVGFAVNNDGTSDAVDVAITGSTNTDGVTLSSGTPVAVGNIAAAGSAPVTLVYHVPEGVAGFNVNLKASAKDTAGNQYIYPMSTANLVYSANVLPAAVSVIDVDSQSLVNNFFFNHLAPTDQQGHFMSVSPDGNYLWVSEQISATGGFVAVLDAATGAQLKQWDVGAGVGNYMSRDGRWLFVASAKLNGITVFDVVNQEYLGSFAIGAANHVMDSSPDGNTLWLTDMGLGNLRSFDITGLPGTLPTPIDTIYIGGSLHALLVHPNGQYVFVGSSTSGTNIVDTNTKSIIKTFAGGMRESPHNYTISPDSKYLLIGDTGYYT